MTTQAQVPPTQGTPAAPSTNGGAVNKAPGTTAKLFGTPAPVADPKVQPTDKKSIPDPTPSKSDAPEYFDPEKNGALKVKYKVDGKEVEFAISDIIRDHQSGKHRENRSRDLDEREKTLKAMDARLKELLTKPVEPAKEGEAITKGIPDDSLFKGDPFVEQMFRDLEGLKADVKAKDEKINALHAELQPARYQRNIENLDQYCRENGYGADFKSYVPKIEAWIDTLPADKKPLADTAESWVTRYLAIKNQELQAKPVPPVSSTQTGAEGKSSVQMPPNIESGGGAPAGAASDDWQARYDAAYKRAVETGSDEAWNAVIALKRQRQTVSGAS